MLHCEKAILFTYDADTDTVTADSDQSLKGKTFSINKGIIARCLRSGKVEVTPNVTEDADFDGDIDNVMGVEVHNMLCCPLTDFESGEVCGIIQAVNKKEFDSHDVDLLQALGMLFLSHSVLDCWPLTEH